MSAIQPGQQVTWTDITGRGRAVVLRTVEGEVVEVHGNTATVKRRNGHRKLMLVSKLPPKGKRTELTRMVLGEEDATR